MPIDCGITGQSARVSPQPSQAQAITKQAAMNTDDPSSPTKGGPTNLRPWAIKLFYLPRRG